MANEETRHLCLSDYDAIGFDLDHTLSKYNIPHLFNTVHQSLSTFMVQKKGYDESLKRPFHLHKDFCTKGLVYDIEKGNFLKLAEDGYILRCSHGFKYMTSDEIKRIYENRHWKETDEFINHVDNIGDGKFMIFENFFDMIGVVTIARAVESLDSKGPRQTSYKQIWIDIMAAYTHTYRYQAFAENTGGFFPPLKSAPGKFMYPCNDEFKKWLQSLKEQNKVLFLMTSSYTDFATFSMDFILGENWQSLFDLCLFYARKPGFFHAGRDFNLADNDAEEIAVEKLESGKSYTKGNCNMLVDFLKEKVKKKDPKVLYIGDSLRSDIFPSKHYAKWSTLMIVEEILAETYEAIRDQLEKEPTDTDTPAAKRVKLGQAVPSVLEGEYLTSTSWGSFFTDNSKGSESSKQGGHTQSKSKDKEGNTRQPQVQPRSTQESGSSGSQQTEMNTLWGYIIRKYADVCVPSLSYIIDLPLDYKFKTFDHNKKHSFGFYPILPAALR